MSASQEEFRPTHFHCRSPCVCHESAASPDKKSKTKTKGASRWSNDAKPSKPTKSSCLDTPDTSLARNAVDRSMSPEGRVDASSEIRRIRGISEPSSDLPVFEFLHVSRSIFHKMATRSLVKHGASVGKGQEALTKLLLLERAMLDERFGNEVCDVARTTLYTFA